MEFKDYFSQAIKEKLLNGEVLETRNLKLASYDKDKISVEFEDLKLLADWEELPNILTAENKKKYLKSL